ADVQSESVVVVGGQGSAEQSLIAAAQIRKWRRPRTQPSCRKNVAALGEREISVASAGGGGGEHEGRKGDAVHGGGWSVHIKCADQSAVGADIGIAGDGGRRAPANGRVGDDSESR